MMPTKLLRTTLVLALLSNAPALLAQEVGPEEAFARYGAAIRSGDWHGAAGLLHSSAVSSLSRVVDRMLKQEVGRRQLEPYIGEDRSDLSLVAAFLRATIAAEPAVAAALADATFTLVTTIPEGQDVHVVYRLTMPVQGATVSRLHLMTFRRDGEVWKTLLTSDLGMLINGTE